MGARAAPVREERPLAGSPPHTRPRTSAIRGQAGWGSEGQGTGPDTPKGLSRSPRGQSRPLSPCRLPPAPGSPLAFPGPKDVCSLTVSPCPAPWPCPWPWGASPLPQPTLCYSAEAVLICLEEQS